ncbi:hypothetical protein [Motiliproteus sp.]|uniref:hypothetical protein n=1 Tax=Motiliproteus sp. TaxID=1898955 RepID=UPI003BAB43C6
MMQWTKILVLLLFFSSASFAAEQAVDVSGYGSDQKRAIADGLAQAVQQLKGVSISSAEMLKSISARVSVSNNDENNSSVSTAVNQSGAMTLESQGIVSRYNVHSLTQLDDMSYQADMTVYVSKYEKPGLPDDSRRRLAVVPFHLDKRTFHLLGDNVASGKVESEFRNKLIDQFTQSRRLVVLDRDFDREFADEKALWLSDDSQLQERAKAGNVLGVDYLVVGRLTSINSRKHVKTLELTGETLSSFSGSAQLDYKIILAATRQVKWSDSIRVKFNDKQIRKMLSQYGSSQAGMTQYLADTLAQKALANIYPMRVVAVKGKTVVLNQGGKTVKKGELLDIYLLGEEMFDPYTKESLGFLEEQIAKVKVLRVNAKTSYAKVVEGEADLIEQDFIARRQ